MTRCQVIEAISVFERKAPMSTGAVEAAIGGPLKNGGTIREPSPAVLDGIRLAYVKARDLASGAARDPSGAEPAG